MPPIFMKKIMDPIHGVISLTKDEVSVIDHILFQRLRYIKQNDILFMTFPSATHTRFSHSLGVMHVGTQMFDSIFSDLEPQHSWAASYIRRVLRLALLLHDCGHLALSHLMEKVIFEGKEERSTQRFHKLWQNASLDVKAEAEVNFSGKLAHEHYSARVAVEILSDSFDDEDFIRDVLAHMEGFHRGMRVSGQFEKASSALISSLADASGCTTDAKVQALKNSALQIRSILINLISGEFDADKLDYIQRDGFYAGVGYGNFDFSGIISSLGASIDGKYGAVLTISEFGLASLQDMTFSRANLFNSINNNPANNGFELLFQDCIGELCAYQGMTTNFAHRLEEMLTNLSEFVYFNDDFIFSEINSRARYASKNREGYSACSRWVKRDNFPCLGYIAYSTSQKPTDKEFAHLLKEASEALPKGSEGIRSSISTTRFSKVTADYTGLLVRKKDYATRTKKLVRITEVTDFFTNFEGKVFYGFYFI